MKIFTLYSVFLSLFLLSGCATSASTNQSPPRPPMAAAAATPTTTASNSIDNSNLKNVQITADANNKGSSDDNYYVQNRVLASGSSVSGALMGS